MTDEVFHAATVFNFSASYLMKNHSVVLTFILL